MAEELHIRRSYQIEGDRRWSYWSAVLKTDDGEAIVASTQPQEVPPVTHLGNLLLVSKEELPTVARFEYENRLEMEGRAFVERLEGEGWEPVERDVHGRVVRMRRDS